MRREEGGGWRISWRCQSERFRVLLWVKSLMRGSEHPASHRSPERRRGERKQKEGEGESITFIFITESSWVKHSEVRRMESPEGEGGARTRHGIRRTVAQQPKATFPPGSEEERS